MGDAVPGATGAARATCGPGYQHQQDWADPDNPTGKSSGQSLFTQRARHGDWLRLCLSCSPVSLQCPRTRVRGKVPGTAPHPAVRGCGESCCQKSQAGSPEPAGCWLPLPSCVGGVTEGEALLTAAAHHKARLPSGIISWGNPAETLVQLPACHRPSLGCRSHGHRSVEGLPTGCRHAAGAGAVRQASPWGRERAKGRRRGCRPPGREPSVPAARHGTPVCLHCWDLAWAGRFQGTLALSSISPRGVQRQHRDGTKPQHWPGPCWMWG